MSRSTQKYHPIAPLGMRWCPYGEHFVSEGEFSGGYCKVHSREYAKTHNHNEKAAAEALKLRTEGINHYGGQCFKCGETDLKTLTLIPTFGVGVVKMARLLRTQKWPKQDSEGSDYQVVCSNCLRKLIQKTV